MELEDETRFKFIVSTPKYNASAEPNVQRVVRKHAIRRFRTHPIRPAITILEGETLVEFLAGRQAHANETGIQARAPQIMPITDKLGAGRSDPFIKYPIVLNSRAKQLIDCLFHDRVGKSAPYRDEWFHTSLMDAGAFHQLLCLASAYLNSIQKGKNPYDSEESLAHHAHAIHLVNKQIKNVATAQSHGVISAIAGFASYYHVLGNFKAWKAHILGLKEIIHLYGGFDTVFQDESLSIILTSVDISGSCDLDTSPHFPFPSRLAPYRVTNSSVKTNDGYSRQPWLSNLQIACGIPLTEILDHLILATWDLRTEISRTQGQICSDCLYIVRNISPLLHRLLSLTPNASNFSFTDIGEVIRLGCILYTITIRTAFGIFTARAITQLKKLKAILMTWERVDNKQVVSEEHGLELLEPWLFGIGFAASRDSEAERAWFEEGFAKALKRMEWSQQDFTNRMSDFLWINHVHDPIFRT